MAWATTHPSLLERLRDPADDVAWTEFDRRYGELIIRYCRGRGLSLADAEDVRQIALMGFARAAGSFEYSPRRGRFRSYLGRVVRNAIARYRERTGGGCLTLDRETLATIADEEPGDELWEREWVRHHLRTAMQTVRSTFAPGSIEVFDLLLAGRTAGQVARQMGMTEDAVHKVKQRIRRRLRLLVSAQLAAEDGTLD